MKTKVIVLSALVSMAFSVAVNASTPASYDTKFNVRANVPDSATITDGAGLSVTDLDVELVPNASGFMEAKTATLKLWNNDVSKPEVSLTLDDSQATDAFTLYSTQGGVLNALTYKVNTVTSAGSQQFAKSGDSKNYTLSTAANHNELPVVFHFISDKKYDELGQGNYSGIVYANVKAKP